MKKILLILSLLVCFSTFAQEIGCQEKLLPYNRHSGLHQLANKEWSDSREVFDAETARDALNWLIFKKLFCRSDEIVVKVSPSCSLIIADIPQSNTCFAFTNLGTFVITRDNGRNVNFIYQKDKRLGD